MKINEHINTEEKDELSEENVCLLLRKMQFKNMLKWQVKMEVLKGVNVSVAVMKGAGSSS